MTTCLSPAEYAMSRAAYTAATIPKGTDRRNAAATAPIRRATPAASATRGGEATRGDGAVPLLRVHPVALGVHHVVDQVDTPREQAEEGERQRRAGHQRRLVKAPREDQAREDQEVLGPLARPERGEEGAEHAGRRP